MDLVRLEALSEWGQQVMDGLGWEDGDSKRVTWSLNSRLLRYYTTLGLLDRAAAFEGRTALYSSKHLLQVLAIKFLQQNGLRLADIQHQIMGLDEAGLAKLIGLKSPLPEYQRDPQPAPQFWQQIPQRSQRSNARELRSYEPVHGVQVLIDPERLPHNWDADELMEAIVRWTEEQR